MSDIDCLGRSSGSYEKEIADLKAELASIREGASWEYLDEKIIAPMCEENLYSAGEKKAKKTLIADINANKYHDYWMNWEHISDILIAVIKEIGGKDE